MDPRRHQEEAIAEALLAEQETPGADVPHAPPPPAQAPVEFPHVIVNNRPLREITADIVQVLHTANRASIMAPATPFCFWTTQKHLTVERTMGPRT